MINIQELRRLLDKAKKEGTPRSWEDFGGIASDHTEELLELAEKKHELDDKLDYCQRILIRIRAQNHPWVEDIILDEFRNEHGIVENKKYEQQHTS